MKPYIPDFQYFLSDAATEDEDRYDTSVVIKCWFMLVKYIKDPAMREKLFEIVKLLHDFLDQDKAIEYIVPDRKPLISISSGFGGLIKFPFFLQPMFKNRGND